MGEKKNLVCGCSPRPAGHKSRFIPFIQFRQPDENLRARAQALVDLILEGGALVFHFLHFLVGGGLLVLLEAADFVVDVVMFGHERIEMFVGRSQFFEFPVKFRELVVDVMMF